MTRMQDVYKEIQIITMEMIRCGMAEEYNYPIIRQHEVVWEKYSDISIYLKNMKYEKIYDEINKEKNYNFKMPDGGLLQLMYRFEKSGILLSHRLAFYPSSSYELYQNNVDLYDEDEIYGDILNKSVLPVIVRADYNKEEVVGAVHHPFVHVTLGDYKNCRIPVNRPISPIQFVNFIMEHFYYISSSKCKYNFGMKKIVNFEEHIHMADRNATRVVI